MTQPPLTPATGPGSTPHAEIVERVARIRARADAATPGPWEVGSHTHPSPGCRCLSCDETVGYYLDHPHALDCDDRVLTHDSTAGKLTPCEHGPLLDYADAAFAADARADIPWLLEQLAAATAERDAARAALGRIADDHVGTVECGNAGCRTRGLPGRHCLACEEPAPCPTLWTATAATSAPAGHRDAESLARATWARTGSPDRWDDLTAGFQRDLVGTAESTLAGDLTVGDGDG